MAKRTAAQNKAIYARRNAAAKAAGFKSYAEQRKYRKEAETLVGKGRDKRSVQARDRVGKELKEYKPETKTLPDLVEQFEDISDLFDLEIDFDSDAWFNFLDEMSPKKGK